MNRVLAGLIVLITALAGACGDAGGNGDAMETDTPTVAPPPPAPPAADSVGMGLPAPADPNRPAGSLGAPGEGESIAATIEDAGIRLSRDTVPAGELNAAVPRVLDQILTKMLAPFPKDRYQTASELIVDLERSRLAAPVPSYADPERALQDPWVRACMATSAQPTQPDLTQLGAGTPTPPEAAAEPQPWVGPSPAP